MNAPVTVSEPNSTSKPSAAICARARVDDAASPPWMRCSTPPTPTSVAASAPNMCETAMRCGIAVVGTHVPSG